MRVMAKARPRPLLLTVAAAAAAISIGAAPALAAAATWTISPGGSVSLTASKLTVKDTSTGTTITCSAGALRGTLKHGGGLNGGSAGSITGGGLTDCTGPVGLTFTVTLLDLPWQINLVAYANGVTQGTITHVEISFSAPGCSFVVDGTAGGASDGVLNFAYTNSTGLAKITKDDLHVYDVNGCFGLVSNGDPVTISATLKFSPKQTITSP